MYAFDQDKVLAIYMYSGDPRLCRSNRPYIACRVSHGLIIVSTKSVLCLLHLVYTRLSLWYVHLDITGHRHGCLNEPIFQKANIALSFHVYRSGRIFGFTAISQFPLFLLFFLLFHLCITLAEEMNRPQLPESLESIQKAEYFPIQRHRWNTNEEIASTLISFDKHENWLSKEVKLR